MKLIKDHSKVTFHKANFVKMLALHIVALGVAPFFFTWQAFAFAFGTALLFGHSLGLFHHMYHTHKSFKIAKPLERFFTLLGTLSYRGPFSGPIQYVAMHRVHHAYSDTEHDPHTPDKGIFYALIAWFWRMPFGFSHHSLYENYTPDFKDETFLRFLDRNVDLLQVIWGTVIFISAGLLTSQTGFDWENATRFLIYGVAVKSLLIIYLGNWVDVVNHRIGYQSYKTSDKSTNSRIMLLIHGGGAISWHNNHHAHPNYFMVRKNWWEFDVFYLSLKVLEKFKLAGDIKVFDEHKNVFKR